MWGILRSQNTWLFHVGKMRMKIFNFLSEQNLQGSFLPQQFKKKKFSFSSQNKTFAKYQNFPLNRNVFITSNIYYCHLNIIQCQQCDPK